MNKIWWKEAIGYQIYPRSFKDSNGDGIGDLEGIIQKIAYLKELGVDFIWLNPIYDSPNIDNGYDISNYQGISPDFGTMDDFKELLKIAHQNDLKIIMDLVVNHTSDQHPWFIESKKSRNNPYHDYYLWEDATCDQMPNNWTSFAGKSTWTYEPQLQQAYFHVFAPQQPDLNWRNPKLREEIYQMMRWWLDLGIDGFRLDAISHLQKAEWDFIIKDDPWEPFMNVGGIEDYLKEMREIFNQYPIMTVGEASGVTSKEALDWTDPNRNGYINMIFEWEHNAHQGTPGTERMNVLEMKNVLARWQKDQEDGGWNALYYENHDNPRINTTLGNESIKSAKAIAMSYFFLSGTPFIYQGQELGMTNYPFTIFEELNDQESKLKYQELIDQGDDEFQALVKVTSWTRDHSRTPMQWDSTKNAGFTDGTPWMHVNPNFSSVNVDMESKDQDSVLNFYKKLIMLRKSDSTFTFGTFDWFLESDPDVFAYIRAHQNKQFLIITNLSDKEKTVEIPSNLAMMSWENVMSNTERKNLTKHFKLKAYDGFVYRVIKRSMKCQ